MHSHKSPHKANPVNEYHGLHHHGHYRAHGHIHGAIDPSLLTAKRGIWAVKWSLIGLSVTAALQIIVVFFTNSVALLADTIHNVGDAATAIPLWIAFSLARRKPSPRYTYGYGRFEDWAGVLVLLIILCSAAVAGYQAVERLLRPQPVEYLWTVMAASIIGFAGNELVAIFRIRVGKEIKSAALIADGYHARVDGLTSLGVLLGALGVWLGFPLADPIIGLLITIAILRIVWDSGKSVFPRLLDGVDPEVVEEIKQEIKDIPRVHSVTEVRVRWLGHRLHAEVNIAVNSDMPVAEAHVIALDVRHRLLHKLNYLSNVTIHIDPEDLSGEVHHSISDHAHENYPNHSHA